MVITVLTGLHSKNLQEATLALVYYVNEGMDDSVYEGSACLVENIGSASFMTCPVLHS